MGDHDDDFDLGLDDDLVDDDADFDPLDEEEEGDETVMADGDGDINAGAKQTEVLDPNDPRVQRADIKPR